MSKQPLPVDLPITKQHVVAAFVEGIHALGQEVDAWRAFGADVSSFLKARDLSDAFGAYQQKRIKARAKKRA